MIGTFGSALSGYACFTCITGEAYPEDDYELEEMFEKNTEKRHIIDRQIAELQESEDDLPNDIPV